MIFACCHPELSESDRIALTLKTCSGFSINEIANTLLTSYESIKKRLQRAKHFIKEKNIQFDIPVGKALEKRLDTVMQVLYLIFNEGYNSSCKEELIRKDLCEEAIRLSLLLTENNYTSYPKCYALISLMCLLASRFEARLDENGEIILLEDQDRSKWNKELISIGMRFLGKSAEGNELSEYHLEAAIVSEHTIAKNLEETNWDKILSLYDILTKMNKSPVIKMNRAIVLGKTSGPQSGINAINAINGIDNYIESNYLFAATLGELYKQVNEIEKAKIYFVKALQLVSSPVEKRLLIKKIESISF
jgi:RNA polymerase sigma-70 factor (ECF subfamily)